MKLYKDPTYTETLRKQRRINERESRSEDEQDLFRNRMLKAAQKRFKRKEKNLKRFEIND